MNTRPLSFLLVCMFCFFSVVGQITQVAVSEPFEEPEDGNISLFILKDGTTMFYHFYKRNFWYQLYDEKQHKTADKQLEVGFDLNKSSILSIFEVQKDIVLFARCIFNDVPKIYRVVINAKNGSVKSEKVLAELPKKFKETRWANSDEISSYA